MVHRILHLGGKVSTDQTRSADPADAQSDLDLGSFRTEPTYWGLVMVFETNMDGFAQVIVLPLGRIVTMGRGMFLVSQQFLGRRFVSKQHPHVCQEPRFPSRAVLVMKLELFSSPVTDFNIGAD